MAVRASARPSRWLTVTFTCFSTVEDRRLVSYVCLIRRTRARVPVTLVTIRMLLLLMIRLSSVALRLPVAIPRLMPCMNLRSWLALLCHRLKLRLMLLTTWMLHGTPLVALLRNLCVRLNRHTTPLIRRKFKVCKARPTCGVPLCRTRYVSLLLLTRFKLIFVTRTPDRALMDS